MKEKKQVQRMLWVSIGLHLTVICLVILSYVITPEIDVESSAAPDAQVVELVEMAELPELPSQQEQEFPEEQDMLAFRTISTILQQPTPPPTSPPTATPVVLPTETPEPTATPRPTVTPTPQVIVTTPTPHPTRRPLPTPRPRIQPRLTPSQETPLPEETVVIEVPRRRPVIQQTPQQRELSAALEKPQESSQHTPSQGAGSGNGTQTGRARQDLSTGPSVTLDQSDAFPYPEYLAYIEEKIAGLWFPQGSGTLSIYLIIARNGKILKSGVDKGEGVGVQKLRNSIIRAIGMIKRFNPLPHEYGGMVLRIRMTVRRE